jgi:hypothetical protein
MQRRSTDCVGTVVVTRRRSSQQGRISLVAGLSVLGAITWNAGLRDAVAQTWGESFQKQLQRCWKKPSGGDGQRTSVSLVVKLKRDGTLDGVPVPQQQTITPFGRNFQGSAYRAIVDCQPYKLPAASYDEWKQFVPTFVDFGQGR